MSVLFYIIGSTLLWGISLLIYRHWIAPSCSGILCRGYLLATLLLGVAWPWLPAISIGSAPIDLPFFEPVYHYEMPTATWAATTEATPANIPIGWVMYGALVFLAFIHVVYKVFRIYHIKATPLYVDGLLLHIHKLDLPPFTFINRIYLHADQLDHPDLDVILHHERQHVRDRHSLDLLFVQLLKCIYLFHPLLFMYEGALKEAHEFSADAATQRHAGVRRYRSLLRSLTMDQLALAITQPFNSSFITRRMKKLQQPSTSIAATLRFTLMLSVILICAVVFKSCDQDEPQEEGASILTEDYTSLDRLREIFSENAHRTLSEEEKRHLEHMLRQAASDVSIDKDRPLPNPTKASTPSDVRIIVEVKPRYKSAECESITDASDRQICANKALLKVLYTNIVYPEQMKAEGVEGTSYAQFIVEKDGSLSNLKIIRSFHSAADAEVLRVIHLMSDAGQWVPGVEEDKIVRVQYVLPVKFKLE